MTEPRFFPGPTHPRRLQQYQDDLSLIDYFNIFRGRIWLIVGMGLTCALLAGVWSYLIHPIYQAQATVVIEQESPGGLERGNSYYHDVSPEYFQTHFELMKSHAVLEQTAHKLHLADQPEYRSHPANETFDGRRLLPEAIRVLLDPKQAPPKTESEEQILEAFAGNIEIRPIRGTRLSYILARSKDPEFAALAANTLASVYIDYSDELASASKGKTAAWFTSHLDDLRNRVGTAQRALHEYRSKHGLLGERERQPVTTHNLVELNSEIVKAEVRKAEAQTRYQQIQSVLGKRTRDGSIDLSSLDSLTEVLTSPLIQNLQSREIDASRKLVELSETYGPLHPAPELRQAKSELQFLHSKIQEEVQKIHDSLKRDYDIATARERAMRETVGRYHTEKMTQEKQHDIQLGVLEREAESSRHLYDIFLKVTKEADVSAGMRSGNVHLATLAVPNSKPVKPRKSLNTMLGLVVGLISGGATALFLDLRNRRVRGIGDVERYLPDVTILGSVPVVKKSISEGDLRLPALLPSGLASESFRAIRTSVLLANASELPSSFLITSPGENEGKTTLAVNLAIAIAQLRETRVVLINADLRTTKTHRIFQVDNGNNKPAGLVHFLLGSADLEDILHPTDLPNLWVIPRGFSPPNPSELLHSKQMRELIRWCQVQGYYVMIDTSPTLLVTDPVVLASQVDGVLLVISAGLTRHEDCQTSLHRLAASGGKVLGVVLQKTKATDLPQYLYPSRYSWAGDRGGASRQSRAS
jgi:polysaccharide biosynthesis transport protein